MLNTNDLKVRLPKLVLASGSPRRSEILASVGWEFEKAVPDIDENVLEGESAELYVERLALAKAQVIADKMPDSIVLGSDTTVVVNGRIIGKPIDLADARKMIASLSGIWHEVLTGVAVVGPGKIRTGLQRTHVKFAVMSDEEIDFLTQIGDPLDKAGAYAV
ncbi:MAG TPA: septum formation protein Maf, partial [Blastocatellia bacterium]|nr:septum formation protein Maf [Blastocatellia bacterium]